jgi:prepilin-type N-terminal cleavage/methylation domain-containing protein
VRPRGFTLIETVVVVAVCAALAAILLPGLRAASGAARTAACTSNLRQLATAAHSYAASFDGAMPAAVLYVLDGGSVRTVAWDFERVGGEVRPGAVWAYSDVPPAVQQCPAYEGPPTGSDPYTGYNYNTSYVGHEGTLPHAGPGGTMLDGWDAARMGTPTTAIRDHASTALFGDGGWRGGANKFMRAPSGASEGDVSVACAGAQAFRHHGGCSCVACLDGSTRTFAVPARGTAPASLLDSVTGFPRNGFLSDDDSSYGGP